MKKSSILYFLMGIFPIVNLPMFGLLIVQDAQAKLGYMERHEWRPFIFAGILSYLCLALANFVVCERLSAYGVAAYSSHER